jgi:CysZ protein
MATILAMGLNFFPVLFPVALLLLCLLMSAQFLDYSWSRHELGLSACFKDVMSNFIVNVFSGAIFLLLVSVPIINVMVPALATSYYTVLWTKRQQQKLIA